MKTTPLRISKNLTCVESNLGEGIGIDKGSTICNDNNKPKIECRMS